ncbi:MAG: hypothetical protein ACJATT_003218 [Myxococcota bacterium]|jgi:hypothetical protein
MRVMRAKRFIGVPGLGGKANPVAAPAESPGERRALHRGPNVQAEETADATYKPANRTKHHAHSCPL